ncbi:MAG: hypothetical protein S4CHLAM81_09600 [Chlamydiales bacterium]|nr:hypothetical protein [Chlamydiales bacterium]MCH9635738.1 hypothetical protein [Chlamydiales bacterium]MCH9703506.1 hypothetical protein [Chlamydiota bacterium]
MSNTITQAEFQALKKEGWKEEKSETTHEGRKYTLIREGNSYAVCCINTSTYVVTAPIVFAITTALTVPACAFACVVSSAQATAQSDTNLSNAEYQEVQRGLESGKDNSQDCISTVCSCNEVWWNVLKPCDTQFTDTKTVVVSPRTTEPKPVTTKTPLLSE